MDGNGLECGMGLIVEMLRLKLAQIEARLALKRKQRKVMQQKQQQQQEKKGEMSALQVPQSPQKSPSKRTP